MALPIILLVEDNADDEVLTTRALRGSGVANEVVVARDGAEALEWLFGEGRHAGRDTSQVPQVILLDLKLPKLSGLEVLHRIRADDRTRVLPVVLLTPSDEEQDIASGYALGANSYVRKPAVQIPDYAVQIPDYVEFDRFVEAVKRLGLYWLVVNHPPAWSPR